MRFAPSSWSVWHAQTYIKVVMSSSMSCENEMFIDKCFDKIPTYACIYICIYSQIEFPRMTNWIDIFVSGCFQWVWSFNYAHACVLICLNMAMFSVVLRFAGILTICHWRVWVKCLGPNNSATYRKPYANPWKVLSHRLIKRNRLSCGSLSKISNA